MGTWRNQVLLVGVPGEPCRPRVGAEWLLALDGQILDISPEADRAGEIAELRLRQLQHGIELALVEVVGLRVRDAARILHRRKLRVGIVVVASLELDALERCAADVEQAPELYGVALLRNARGGGWLNGEVGVGGYAGDA